MFYRIKITYTFIQNNVPKQKFGYTKGRLKRCHINILSVFSYSNQIHLFMPDRLNLDTTKLSMLFKRNYTVTYFE